jgi:hypothetical protein
MLPTLLLLQFELRPQIVDALCKLIDVVLHMPILLLPL